MAIYAAYLPPNDEFGSTAERFRLVQDGKTPWALIAPPFWLIWHRLWLPLLAYAVFMFAIALIAIWQPGLPVLYLSALPGFYLLLEGSELVRNRLEILDWRFAGIVEGYNLEEAEIRFLATFQEGEPELVAFERPSKSPISHRPVVVAGLFPE